jgi:hypothetical protein
VAVWVGQVAARHSAVAVGTASVEIVDIADLDLPLLDEPVPAAFGQYTYEHTLRWSQAIGSFDGFVMFVTPECNRSLPAALRNAIDFLYAEWRNKAAGFVSYGIHGGTLTIVIGPPAHPGAKPADGHVATSEGPAPRPAGPLAETSQQTRSGRLVLALATLVMIAVMPMAPVHLHHLGHGLGAIGIVTTLHIGAMFAPSALSARLVDRVGPKPSAAGDSRHTNPWATDRYDKARACGRDHPHAVRILARAWAHVIWHSWQDGVTYNPATHCALPTILNQDQPNAA